MGFFQASSLSLLYVATFGVAALACIASLTRLQRITDPDTRRGLRALLLTSGGWAAAHVGFLVSPTRALKLGWYTLGLVLGLAAVGAWLYFCSAFTGRTYHQHPTYRRLAIGVYIVLVTVKVTNPVHHEYFTTTAVATPFPHLSVYTGPLHWSAMAFSYALAFVGYFMLLELFTEIDLDTRPLVALVGITALPAVLDLIGYTTPWLIDITYEPLGVAVFAVGVAFVYIDRFDTVQLAAERDTPVIALDADNNIRETNHAARTIFPALADAHRTRLETTLPEVADCLDSDDPILKHQQDGAPQYYRLTEAPYGTVKAGLGRTIVFSDVTERERYRRELERQNDRLEQFASMVSHDLRNPLNVATGSIELARTREDVTHLERAESALHRMDALIDDLLVLSRSETQLEDTVVLDLQPVARAAWEELERDEGRLRVQAETPVVDGDRSQLKHLFANLFRNALDHNDPPVTVTVGPLADGNGFFVADDGCGIDAEDHETVFEHGYTTHSDGTGFGLSIVRHIAEAHGWDVTVTDSQQGGARFEFRTD